MQVIPIFFASRSAFLIFSEFPEVESKVTRTVKERDETTPVTTIKDVKRAAVESGAKADDDRPLRILSSKKISDAVDYFDSLIKANGRCLDGTFIAPVEQLKLVRAVLNNNILANDEDFKATVQRHVTRKKVETEEGQ